MTTAIDNSFHGNQVQNMVEAARIEITVPTLFDAKYGVNL